MSLTAVQRENMRLARAKRAAAGPLDAAGDLWGPIVAEPEPEPRPSDPPPAKRPRGRPRKVASDPEIAPPPAVQISSPPGPSHAAAPPSADAVPFSYAAHGLENLESARRHAVAKCRWCGKGFVLLYGLQWVCETLDCAQRQVDHAIAAREARPGGSPWFYLPLPLQVEMESPTNKHMLVAGAAGVAKSYGARMLAYRFLRKIAGLRVLILRCTYDQLNKNHLQYIPLEAERLGAKWIGGNVRQLSFPHPGGNDSILFAGYCDVKADIGQHIGPEWDIVLLEESVMFLPEAISEITARARGSATAVEAKIALGLNPKWSHSWGLSNPGGRAMLHLVDHYITRTPDPEIYPTYKPEMFGFITCTLEDNPYLEETYEQENLSHLEAARYRQLRYGDWTAIAGQFFSRFDGDVHIVRAS